jgi:Xaa-Pro dipeptidase
MAFGRREFLRAAAVAPLATGSAQALNLEDPISSLEDSVQDLDPLPREAYAARIEKARRLMAENFADAFFVEGGSSLNYFTGVRWGQSERTFGVLIPGKGKPTFICPAFEEGRARERMGMIDADLRVWQEHESPFELVAKLLSDWSLRAGTIAIDPGTRYFIVQGLANESSTAAFYSGRRITDGCRMVKSPSELKYMYRANEITKKAYHAALTGLKEGMTPAELGRRISDAHSKMGVRGGAMVLFGPASAFPHGTRESRKLQQGDSVLIDGGCSVHGYRSDVTRTAIFGKPSDKQRKVWDTVLKAQKAALAAARPGVECQELDRVARGVIEDAGYGPGYRYFTHRLGHGIGIDGHEAPYLVKDNELELEPGMTFSDEPGIYIIGEFGVRHEDVMVITENGAEFMGPPTQTISNPV